MAVRQPAAIGVHRQAAFWPDTSTADEASSLAFGTKAQILQEHQLLKLKSAIRALPAEEALLLQLRFEQDLSLEEIARLSGLGDAQRVHRKLALVIKKVRCGMV